MKCKLYAVVIGIFLLIVGLFITSLLLGSLPGNGNGNGNGQTTSSTTVTIPPQLVGLQNPETAAKYFVAGVKTDDTVVVIDPAAQDEIVLNLEHRKWKQPKWSADGKLLAVLGMTDDVRQVYDIFIYDLSRAEWTKATDYASLPRGVDGYAWLDASRLMFTQGESNNHWLHRFDYRNSETRKEFQTGANLLDVHLGNQRLVLQDPVTREFFLYSFKGEEIIRFDDVTRPGLAAIYTKDREDVVLADFDAGLFTWDFNSPEFVQLTLPSDDGNFYPLCVLAEGNILLVQREVEVNAFLLKKYVYTRKSLEGGQRLDVLASKVNEAYPQFNAMCTETRAVISVIEGTDEDELEYRWYLADLDPLKLQYIQLANNYRDLSLR